MFIIKYILFSFIFFTNNTYTIDKVYEGKIFYNFVQYEDELYVSSNKGVFKIESSNNNSLLIFKKDIIGPIKTNFSKNQNYKIKFQSPVVEIKPPTFLNAVTDYAFFNNSLFIIRRGKLVSFKKLSYEYSPYESVRSITKNTVGSYNGVFINGKKLKKLKYTDGQIKEFDSITFVCYKGLLSYENNKETIIYRGNDKRNEKKYGNIYDIFLINHPNYLVISSNGLYNYNSEMNTFDLIYSTQKKIIPARVNKNDNKIGNNSVFSFVDKNELISINVNTLETKTLGNWLEKNVDDILLCDVEPKNIYTISENKYLHYYKANSDGLELIEKTPINLTAHTISDFGNLIFLSGNNGLSIYDKNKRKMFDGYILDEFNKNAVYKSENEISFGSIHGVYSFKNLKEFSKNLIFTDFKIEKSYKSEFFFFLIALFILITILVKKYNSSNKINISREKLVLNIKNFIQNNLNSVTLKMLEDKFDLAYYEINSLDKDFKPAVFIKNSRKIKAQKMFFDKKSMSEIAQKTGYSETYLLKNKTRFINKNYNL
ncbi:hypothetical protein N9X56_00160 [Flavobacteriaceae bacterium]|nr:hypothetical protein [Flavobacteriaceae bacterium]